MPLLTACSEPAAQAAVGAAPALRAAAPVAAVVSPEQAEAYAARRPKSVLEAQPYRVTTQKILSHGAGRSSTVTLVDVAPAIGVWFVLSRLGVEVGQGTWHLENPLGVQQKVRIDATCPAGLVLTRMGQDRCCDLWGTTPGALDAAQASGRVYGSLCDGALVVRNPTIGHKTAMEWTTDLIRDHVYGGERITSAVKQTLLADSQRVEGTLGGAGAAQRGGPLPADVAPAFKGRLLGIGDLSLPVVGGTNRQLTIGEWYPVRAVAGVWASVLRAGSVSPAVLERNAGGVLPLDALESTALVYSVAFDLADFELGYEVGTDHPRVGWSERVQPAVHDFSLPGPDGFDTVAPFVRTGLLDPAWLSREVAVFVGGFKRSHGAFKQGELSRVNNGSHYGFVEYGAELSKLQPGLATLVVWADQSVELRTWTVADAARLPQVRHARQNGVALLETDPVTGLVRPGALVRDWARGNWSGSVEGEQRSVRSGVCIQDTPAGRYLMYSYFSSATPSAMANVYAAYGCSYAMLLDMNALEHTYLAVHDVEEGQFTVHHLVSGMDVLDQKRSSGVYARFVGYADNRDFFTVLRKP